MPYDKQNGDESQENQDRLELASNMLKLVMVKNSMDLEMINSLLADDL